MASTVDSLGVEAEQPASQQTGANYNGDGAPSTSAAGSNGAIGSKDVLLTLGDYQFSVSSLAPQNIDTTQTWRWPAQEVLGDTPALQFVGAGAKTMQIKGFLLPHWSGGYTQLAALKAQADNAEPLLMVSGDGTIQGWWVIKQLVDSGSALDNYGRPRKIDVTISLEYFGQTKERWDA